MKKQIVLIIIILMLNIVPAFSVTTNTQQLNKQVLEYIKTNKIDKAIHTLAELYDNAKTQKDYEFIIYDTMQMINNDKIPAVIRINFCYTLQAIDDSQKVTDQKLKNIIDALQFKIVSIVANADENDMIFTKIFKEGKDKTLKTFHDVYSKKVESSNGSAVSLVIFACYENALGNNYLALRIFNGAMDMRQIYGDKILNEDVIKIWTIVTNNFNINN